MHRFLVSQTVEENVASLSAARSAGMDMAAAATAHHAGGVGAGRDMLTVRDVAVMLRASWDPTGGVNVLGGAGPGSSGQFGQGRAVQQVGQQLQQRPPRAPRQPRVRARARLDPALMQHQEEGHEMELDLRSGRRLRSRLPQQRQQRQDLEASEEEVAEGEEEDEESEAWEEWPEDSMAVDDNRTERMQPAAAAAMAAVARLSGDAAAATQGAH